MRLTGAGAAPHHRPQGVSLPAPLSAESIRTYHRIMRIVSLAPNVTSILVELGASDALAGITRWCKDVLSEDQFQRLYDVPQFDDCWNADPAAVAALAPDLVIGSVPYRAQVVDGLIARGLRFLATYPRCLADIDADIRLLSRIVDATAKGEELIGRMQREIDAISTRLAQAGIDGRRPKVYCEEWSNPLQNSQVWVAEMVTACGGEFVPLPAARKVNAEEVIAANPDLIVVAWCGTHDRSRPDVVRKRAGWEGIAAVRQGRIHAVPDELLNTPGPKLVDGLKALARLLHPELFPARPDT
jgi:iron complex transport system substrate-binding protein